MSLFVIDVLWLLFRLTADMTFLQFSLVHVICECDGKLCNNCVRFVYKMLAIKKI